MTRDESVATKGDRVNTFSYYIEISAVMFCHTNQMPVCSLVICILRAYSVWVLRHAISPRTSSPNLVRNAPSSLSPLID